MTTVDILTTTIRPEMVEFCTWLFRRQETGAELRHVFGGSTTGREQALRGLVSDSHADYFILADDDDYVAPGYVQRCLHSIPADAMFYGEIPRRAYLMSPPAYGESEERQMLFQTFTLYRRGVDPFACGVSKTLGVHTDDLIVMRGLMKDPSTAVTVRKNTYSAKHWPHLDPDHTKLREWLADDPEAFDRYMEMSR